VRDSRQTVLDSAYAAHPERFHRDHPKAPELPARVWINQTPSKIESEENQPPTKTP
jgi:putative transposase